MLLKVFKAPGLRVFHGINICNVLERLLTDTFYEDVKMLLLFGQNLHMVHSEEHRQKLNSISIYFPTAILPQGAVYVYVSLKGICIPYLVLIYQTRK